MKHAFCQTTPPNIDEQGSPLDPDIEARVATATFASGAPGSTCWGAGAGEDISVGYADGTGPAWSNGAVGTCAEPLLREVIRPGRRAA